MSLPSTIRLFHHASHHAFPVGRNGSFGKRLKFVLRGLRERRENAAWFVLLRRDPFFQRLAAHDHRMYRKLYRPYLSATWDKRRVREVIQQHYQLTGELLPASVHEAIHLGDAFELACWQSNRNYTIRASHDPKFYQEGEITLTLLCPDLGEGPLAQLSLTLAIDPAGTRTLFLGGMQGAARDLGPAAIKEAGKDLHGLRPKSLILSAGQILATTLGCQSILATTNARHAYSTDDRRKSKELGKMFFDYDAFWEECAGVRENEAFYSIPLVSARRPRESMKPQKRPMYQRRYALLDEIEVAVSRSLGLTMDRQS